jgi:hypothetical protein
MGYVVLFQDARKIFSNPRSNYGTLQLCKAISVVKSGLISYIINISCNQINYS